MHCFPRMILQLASTAACIYCLTLQEISVKAGARVHHVVINALSGTT